MGKSISGTTVFDSTQEFMDISFPRVLQPGWAVDVVVFADKYVADGFTAASATLALSELRRGVDMLKSRSVSPFDDNSETLIHSDDLNLEIEEADTVKSLLDHANTLLSQRYKSSVGPANAVYDLADISTVYAELCIARIPLFEACSPTTQIDECCRKLAQRMSQLALPVEHADCEEAGGLSDCSLASTLDVSMEPLEYWNFAEKRVSSLVA